MPEHFSQDNLCKGGEKQNLKIPKLAKIILNIKGMQFSFFLHVRTRMKAPSWIHLIIQSHPDWDVLTGETQLSLYQITVCQFLYKTIKFY